ncbi:hypothetical protein P692DRAFT_20825164, partial [Suillus brevipes Sb2]
MSILPPPPASELLKSKATSHDRQSEASESEFESLLISYSHGLTGLSLTFYCNVVIPLHIPQHFAALT